MNAVPPAERIAALEAELAAQRAEMQALMATVSHDLRAPLRHITSYVQLVQEDAGPLLNPEVQGFLGTIAQSARHLGAQLDGLLALSRVGAATVALQTVALGPLVQSVADEWGAKAGTRAIEWTLDAPLPTVLADAALLREALVQLLGNAVKFSAARTPAVIAVRAVAGAADGGVTLQVHDNGVGFNPAQQAALFQVFGRLHSVKQFDGLGIGLVLARKALQRMGATVAIAAVPEGAAEPAGCTVTMTFPCADGR